MRLVRFWDNNKAQYEFLTNNCTGNASTVASFYKERWEVETIQTSQTAIKSNKLCRNFGKCSLHPNLD